MNKMDVQTGPNVCLLGYDVAKKLFKEGIERAVNSVVRINNIPFPGAGCIGKPGIHFWF